MPLALTQEDFLVLFLFTSPVYFSEYPSKICIKGNPDEYEVSRTLRLKGNGTHFYEECPLGIFDPIFYSKNCDDDKIHFGSTFYVEMLVKAPRHKSTPLIKYQYGQFQYDWVDIAIETKQPPGIDHMTFENKHLNEIITLHAKSSEKHQLKRISSGRESVLLLHVHQHSDVKNDRENVGLGLRIKKKTRYFYAQTMSEVHFQTTLKLDSYTRHYAVSLPGEYESVEFDVDNFTYTSFPKRAVIHAMWFKDVYNSFKTFNYEPPLLGVNTGKMSPEKYYLYLEIKVSNHKNYLFFPKYWHPVSWWNVIENSLPRKWERTWNEASELCESMGGHLPVFNSRDDLDELLAIFKRPHMPYEINIPGSMMPAIPAIYIGLTSNENRNVSYQK